MEREKTLEWCAVRFLGIDDFLDNVTVLPPGEWDPKTRIEPPKNIPNKVRMTPSDTQITMCLVII